MIQGPGVYDRDESRRGRQAVLIANDVLATLEDPGTEQALPPAT